MPDMRPIVALLTAGLTASLAVGTAAAPSATAAPAAPSSSSTHDAAVQQVPRPLVLGHRGASGYRPEHTLASYRLAIRMGADYIEPDLVSTKDGVLVARHENVITDTTDVADHPEFADRETTKTIDGTEVTGWFTEDFTLAELRTLRAVERLPDLRPGNAVYDGRFRVPTFEQVLDLLDRHEARTGDRVGVYPETKHPTYFRSIGLPLEPALVATLDEHGLDTFQAKVFLQSFETRNLRMLNRLTPNKLIQLVDSSGAPYDFVASGDPRTYADLVKPRGLRFIARYADGIGPNKDLVIPRDEDGYLLHATRLVDNAHAVGLLVHAFTFRSENEFLPADLRSSNDPADHGEAVAEDLLFLQQGLDGFFTDFPDTGVKARNLYLSRLAAG